MNIRSRAGQLVTHGFLRIDRESGAGSRHHRMVYIADAREAHDAQLYNSYDEEGEVEYLDPPPDRPHSEFIPDAHFEHPAEPDAELNTADDPELPRPHAGGFADSHPDLYFVETPTGPLVAPAAFEPDQSDSDQSDSDQIDSDQSDSEKPAAEELVAPSSEPEPPAAALIDPPEYAEPFSAADPDRPLPATASEPDPAAPPPPVEPETEAPKVQESAEIAPFEPSAFPIVHLDRAEPDDLAPQYQDPAYLEPENFEPESPEPEPLGPTNTGFEEPESHEPSHSPVAPSPEREAFVPEPSSPADELATPDPVVTYSSATLRARYYAPLHHAFTPEQAELFDWVAETDTIQTYEHRGTFRYLHIDGETGQFFNQRRQPISREAALLHVMPPPPPIAAPAIPSSQSALTPEPAPRAAHEDLLLAVKDKAVKDKHDKPEKKPTRFALQTDPPPAPNPHEPVLDAFTRKHSHRNEREGWRNRIADLSRTWRSRNGQKDPDN